MSASPLLQLQDVGRELGGRAIVADLSLTLDRGGVLGLLGVNGAGKTTTLRMIAGVLAPSRGSVRIAGADPGENFTALRQLGYLPERPPLYPELRVDEYLDFCARLRGVRAQAAAQAVAGAIERCELGNVRRRLLGNLSKGYAQRVGIAQAIVHNPPLIVLDEPVSGLDPLQAAKLRALVRELGRDHGVILSTHLLHDVGACCNRVAILHRGRLRHDGPMTEHGSAARWRVVTTAAVDATQWTMIDGVQSAEFADGAWRVCLTPSATSAQLSAAIVGRGWGLSELRPDDAGLEALFARIASADDVREAA
jgi:ABC-2 type transport system ATP-binding protein